MTNLKKGQMENEDFRRCQQIHCGFFIKGGCKPCDDCKAQPFILNKSCTRCLRCASVSMSIRWDDDDTKELKDAVSENPDGITGKLVIVVGGVPDERFNH